MYMNITYNTKLISTYIQKNYKNNHLRSANLNANIEFPTSAKSRMEEESLFHKRFHTITMKNDKN